MKSTQLIIIGNAQIEMENFLCTVLQSHFISEGISFNTLIHNDVRFNIWHVAKDFEDFNTIQHLLHHMNIIIYSVDIDNATKLVGNIQALMSKFKAVQLFMETQNTRQEDYIQFANQFQLESIHFELGSYKSAAAVLDKVIQMYNNQVANTIQQFKSKLFK
ncbi:hypothetical protein SS50377_20058 [Spironucleus salmonicida]|uniref:Uncharacterized protein n=1 Tax=Spironucleus salmonicida TaxID=348837 RepID=V6LYN5_9EUKA|nr:hypothetical protein SS50377_20058 [Spironucleus salmonicida]|eukprot:EST49373.1 Hypothetical protein SS50377_10298 [Spironucleus salmonicida]